MGANLESLSCPPNSPAYQADLHSEVQGWRASPSAMFHHDPILAADEQDDRMMSLQPKAIPVGVSGL